MQNSAWIELLRLLPPERQHNLSFTTRNGNEIALHSIVRVEPEYLVIRGRLMGTMDGGSFFVVPYDQITYVALPRLITEAEVRALFGEVGVPATSATPAEGQPAAAGAAAENGKPADPGSGNGSAPPRTPESNDNRQAEVDKTSLLERLRARRAAVDTASFFSP